MGYRGHWRDSHGTFLSFFPVEKGYRTRVRVEDLEFQVRFISGFGFSKSRAWMMGIGP